MSNSSIYQVQEWWSNKKGTKALQIKIKSLGKAPDIPQTLLIHAVTTISFTETRLIFVKLLSSAPGRTSLLNAHEIVVDLTKKIKSTIQCFLKLAHSKYKTLFKLKKTQMTRFFLAASSRTLCRKITLGSGFLTSIHQQPLGARIQKSLKAKVVSRIKLN